MINVRACLESASSRRGIATDCGVLLFLLSICSVPILNAQRFVEPIQATPSRVVTIDSESLLLEGVSGVARLTENRILVASIHGAIVALVDSAGALVRMVGRTGSGPGEFRSVAWVGRCNERDAFVFDRANARMSVVDSTGTVIREFAISDSAGRSFVPSAVACSSVGVLAAQTIGRETAGSGATSGTVRFRSDIWSGPATVGRLTRIAASLSDEMFTMAGGGAPVPLGRRSVLAVSLGAIVTGTGESASLTLHESTQRRREIITGIPSRRTTPEAFDDGVEEVLAMVPPAVVPRLRPVVSTLSRPSEFAPYEAVKADECGRLWVTYRRADAGGHGLRVLGGDGRVLGEVSLRDRATMHEVFNGFVVSSSIDEEGVVRLLTYRVNLPFCR